MSQVPSTSYSCVYIYIHTYLWIYICIYIYVYMYGKMLSTGTKDVPGELSSGVGSDLDAAADRVHRWGGSAVHHQRHSLRWGLHQIQCYLEPMREVGTVGSGNFEGQINVKLFESQKSNARMMKNQKPVVYLCKNDESWSSFNHDTAGCGCLLRALHIAQSRHGTWPRNSANQREMVLMAMDKSSSPIV